MKYQLDEKVTDADVEERIERERNNLAEWLSRKLLLKIAFTVVIDFVGSIDGVSLTVKR